MWSFLAPAPESGLQPGPVPTFSVVIAAYQAADTIGEAIESVLVQTVPPLEVIVVDDGSTDDISNALTPFRDRIALIAKENGGGASALNAGLSVASGDFVAILDADDSYEPERIAALGALASERPDLDLLTTDAHIEIDGRTVARFCAETPFAVDDQRSTILDRCFVAWPAVRRDRLIAVNGYDEALRIAYDWDCYLRLILAGARAGLVEVPLYRYSFASGSLSSHRPAALRERILLLEKADKSPNLRPSERPPLRRALKINRSRTLLAEAEAALRAGHPDARRRSLAVAGGPHFGLETRVKALAAALAPREAGRRLTAAEAEKGWSRLQRGYPRG